MRVQGQSGSAYIAPQSSQAATGGSEKASETVSTAATTQSSTTELASGAPALAAINKAAVNKAAVLSELIRPGDKLHPSTAQGVVAFYETMLAEFA